MNKLILLLLPLILCSCKTIQPNINSFDGFVQPNQVIMREVVKPLPKTKVNATFGMGNNPAVIKAYQQFIKTGRKTTIRSKGFKTIPYDPHAQPILACAPLHLCVIQLERGETINHIAIGDSVNWLIDTALVGTSQDGSYQITIKPKDYNVATDVVITTTKRTYYLGIISEKGRKSEVVNFYYPEETLNRALLKSKQSIIQDTHTVSSQINIEHINFDYQLSGNKPPWMPVRVFDDGSKTFIQMPEVARHMDLPVLYLQQGSQKMLVNYRYRAPYFVIDRLFQTAILFNGKGNHREQVIIHNGRLMGGAHERA